MWPQLAQVSGIISINATSAGFLEKDLKEKYDIDYFDVIAHSINSQNQGFLFEFLKTFGYVPSSESMNIYDDTDLGFIKFWGLNGKYSNLYRRFLVDYQPISKMNVWHFRAGYSLPCVLLDGKNAFPDAIESEDIFFTINIADKFEELLNQNMIFVMRDDLQKLITDLRRQTSAPQIMLENSKPANTVHRNTLLKLIIGMAVDHYGYDPTESKSSIPSELQTIMELHGIECTDDTIRKALKEAAAFLPQKNK
jgi:hypothetical protein